MGQDQDQGQDRPRPGLLLLQRGGSLAWPAPLNPNPAPVNPADPVLRSIALSAAVTPGIHQHTYTYTYRDSPDDGPDLSSRPSSPSYFSQADRRVDVTSTSTQPSPSQPATPSIPRHNLPTSPGSIAGKDILKRITFAAAMGRRESLSQIRASNPDLQLSGNIISATFNIPHSLKYRKGSDWVSLPLCLPLPLPLRPLPLALPFPLLPLPSPLTSLPAACCLPACLP